MPFFEKLSRTHREHLSGWLFAAPAVFLALVFFVGPMIVSFLLSFKEYSMLDRGGMMGAPWVGLSNYQQALNDPTLVRAFINTFTYALFTVPIQLVIALALALVCNAKIKGKSFYRTAYYIPTITSAVAVSIMFLFLYKTDGLLNQFLAIFGYEPVNFFNNPTFALPSIISMAVWSSVGLYMVVFLAGLQQIPASLYEAAEIDGAGKWSQFWNITLPMLQPTVFFNLVVSMIGCLQVFDQAYIVSGGGGGPLDSTMTVVLYLYNTGFRDLEMGYASAISFILFAVIMTLTLIQKRLFKEEAH